ncbi:Uu.00g011610.m01.CDS01 [Anthostomella pinea]|uniref:Uu.00g011610.m01.CDS01 n=1 Tax=Anthostomella pinea TaxID=933095 RepID=A0AAI8VXT4_9PEZI|nr:Uu.00g011610.m01.CDS01 [Anthostomella pinea]
MPLPSDAALPAGSLVLVTGANGLVATHVVNEALSYGYRVRGTVRDPHKCAWLQEFYDKKYGPGKFELIQVKRLDEEGSLGEAVKGCAGVIHVASIVSFGPDPNATIPESIAFTLSALKSAASSPAVKRFVLTSSSSAATQGLFNTPYDLTPQSWNTAAVEKAWAPPPYEPSGGVAVYSASKVQAEQAMWKFMDEQNPDFVANSVLPDYVLGLPMNLEVQGYTSSVSFLAGLWNGDTSFKVLYPQFSVDAGDAGALHVAALANPTAKGERVFGYADNKTWTDWIGRLRGMYPGHQFPDPPENEGKDMANVTARPRAEELLKWLGRPGFRPLEESLKEVCDTMAL